MSIAALIAVGWLLWGLLEYLLHRLIGHGIHSPLRDRHLEHHRNPTDTGIDPTWAVFSVMLLIGTAMTAEWLLCVTGGCVAGYLGYELIHWRAHRNVWSCPRHLAHHATLTKNYGVTTSLWDWMFATKL